MTPQNNNITLQQKQNELVNLFEQKVKDKKLRSHQVSLLIDYLYDLARYVDNEFYLEMKKRNLTKDHESVLALRFYDDKLQETITKEKIDLEYSVLPDDFFVKVKDYHDSTLALAVQIKQKDKDSEPNNYFNIFFPEVSSYVSNTMDAGKRFAKIYSAIHLSK
jgi:hypothetical protein